MPFDVIPQETRTKFQHLAEAMLRGCAVSEKCVGAQYSHGKTCAIGAIFLGMGHAPRVWDGDDCGDFTDVPGYYEEMKPLQRAYVARYGTYPAADNNSGMSREEIAARIAAL